MLPESQISVNLSVVYTPAVGFSAEDCMEYLHNINLTKILKEVELSRSTFTGCIRNSTICTSEAAVSEYPSYNAICPSQSTMNSYGSRIQSMKTSLATRIHLIDCSLLLENSIEELNVLECIRDIAQDDENYIYIKAFEEIITTAVQSAVELWANYGVHQGELLTLCSQVYPLGRQIEVNITPVHKSSPKEIQE